MKSDDKWLLFKNYLHNELGITKEDIREWIDEAVRDEATKMVNNEFNSFNVRTILNNIITTDKYGSSNWGKLRTDITETIVKELTAKLEITINAKK